MSIQLLISPCKNCSHFWEKIKILPRDAKKTVTVAKNRQQTQNTGFFYIHWRCCFLLEILS